MVRATPYCVKLWMVIGSIALQRPCGMPMIKDAQQGKAESINNYGLYNHIIAQDYAIPNDACNILILGSGLIRLS